MYSVSNGGTAGGGHGVTKGGGDTSSLRHGDTKGGKVPRSVMLIPQSISAASHFLANSPLGDAHLAPEGCILNPGWKRRLSGQEKHQNAPESNKGSLGFGV